MTHAYETVKQFLQSWPPISDPSGSPLASQTLALLAATDPGARSERLAATSDLYRLHVVYRQLGMLREGKSEKVERFQELLDLSIDDFATALERGEAQPYLDLLQFCLELGRYRLEPRHTLMRRFLSQIFALKKFGIGLKFSLYPGNVLYSAAGKTHDELARDLARLGMAGPPLAGGTIVRKGPLTLGFDLESRAYKATNDPEAVRGPLLRWIRNTGGDEQRVKLEYESRHPDAAPELSGLHRSHRFG